jgi:hypothetical protein
MDFAGDCDDFEGVPRTSSEGFLNFCEDFRGGGLGGGGVRRFFFFFFSLPFPSPLTVEFDDDDVTDSRNEGWSCETTVTLGSSLSEKLPAALLVGGGLLMAGLPCGSRGGLIFIGAIMPGDCEDIDVGVVSLLYAAPGPGDSENLVEGLALYPLPLYPLYRWL